MFDFLLFDLFLVILFVVGMIGVGFYIRNHLLHVWQEVSRLELTFHKQLFETLTRFKEDKVLLKSYACYQFIQNFNYDAQTKLRHLELNERQNLFKSLQKVYGEIYKVQDSDLYPIKKQFETLQNCRLKYNSKVLLYNQKIHTFPVKFFAKRMRFVEKEYFA